MRENLIKQEPLRGIMVITDVITHGQDFLIWQDLAQWSDHYDDLIRGIKVVMALVALATLFFSCFVSWLFDFLAITH